MKALRGLICSLAFVGCASTLTVRELPSPLDVDPTAIRAPPLQLSIRQPQRRVLGNGLQVYLQEDHATPLVSLRVLAAVGQVDDPAAQVGLASVTAALMAEGGAGDRSAELLEAFLDARGADLVATPGDETSLLSLSVRADDLSVMVPLLADVVRRPRFEAARFATQMARTQEALRRRDDRPDGVAQRLLTRAMYGADSLLGREATPATVAAISLEDVRRFHAARWGVRSVRLVISGDFEAAAVLAMLEREFGDWAGGAPVERRFEPPSPPVARVLVVPRPIAQAKVRVGTFGYARRSADEFPLRLLATGLGSFGVGRLYREIRDERGLAYSASASVSAGPSRGQFTVAFDTRPAQVTQALSVALQVLREAGGPSPLTAEELRTARDMATQAFAFRFEGASRIALEKATLDLFGYDADYLQAWRARVEQTDAAEVQRAAASLSGLQIVIVGPLDQLGDLSVFGPVQVVSDVASFR